MDTNCAIQVGLCGQIVWMHINVKCFISLVKCFISFHLEVVLDMLHIIITGNTVLLNNHINYHINNWYIV